jgi:superfamily II DNA or RNA helicase
VAKAVPPIPLDPVAPEPEPELTAEQQEIVNRVLKRESVFFTGPAGCGKSVVVRAIIAAFDSLNAAHNAALQDPASRSAALHEGPWRLAVTASTGLAGM